MATAASATPSPVTGLTTNLSVLGADTLGESTLTYTWSATGPSGAAAPTYSVNGTNASKNTTATFSQAGSYTFTVTISDDSGQTVTSSVNVTVNQTLTTIAVTPPSPSIYENQTQQFTATAFDQFGIAMATQPTITWSEQSAASARSAQRAVQFAFGVWSGGRCSYVAGRVRESTAVTVLVARADDRHCGVGHAFTGHRHDDELFRFWPPTSRRGGLDLHLVDDFDAQRRRGADLQRQRHERGAEHDRHVHQRRQLYFPRDGRSTRST